MKKDPLLYIEDILGSIAAILDYTKDIHRDDFFTSQLIQDAVCRRLEIIGEAANKLPKEFTSQYKEIPWTEMVGMRNLLIHDYARVDPQIVWDTIKLSLPDLKKKIERLIPG